MIWLVLDTKNYPIAAFHSLKEARAYADKGLREGYDWSTFRIAVTPTKEAGHQSASHISQTEEIQ